MKRYRLKDSIRLYFVEFIAIFSLLSLLYITLP